MPPDVSVVIPTYNRAELLRRTLTALAAQRMPAERFEVIVADDGSGDHTRDVVRDFAGVLRMEYHFQNDLGFRAGAARNAGARLATAPVLVFADTGVLAGPDFLDAHLGAHRGRSGPARAVVGYTYGYRVDNPTPGLDVAAATMTPEEIVRSYDGSPALWDMRHPAYLVYGFDLRRSLLPWQFFWSVNCSVPAADFHAAGGFDEDFRSWGGEDLELGFRLFRRGLEFQIGYEAWAVDTPHPRATTADIDTNRGNILTFLYKHPEPIVELLWAWFMREQPWFGQNHDWYVETEYPRLSRAAAASRTVDVTGELAALRELPAGTRVAVLGCGGQLPGGVEPAALIDFDRQRLRELPAALSHSVHHAVGIRTVLPDDAVDLVFITSRLAPLWPRWGPLILAEARRIGRAVRGPLVAAEPG
ncbi:glycosyltransferase [Actinoplanes sp. NPDC026619]|uniref:glycosyltransferase n=1 Tax=Actinoplanes sp. NPDC026619 TaxID=3155798 RepID=UPI0033CFCF18